MREQVSISLTAILITYNGEYRPTLPNEVHTYKLNAALSGCQVPHGTALHLMRRGPSFHRDISEQGLIYDHVLHPAHADLCCCHR